MSSTLASQRTILVVAPATLEENYTFDVTLGDHHRPFTVTVPAGGVRKGQEFEIPYPSSSSDDDDSSSIAGYDNHLYTRDGDDDDTATRMVDEEKAIAADAAAPSLQIATASSSSQDEDGDDTSTDQQILGAASSEESATGAPYGRWRHPLCACGDVLTQSTFWMALFCAPVLTAQLVTRLGLTWRGQPAVGTASPSSVTAFGEAVEEASLSFNKIVLSFVAVLVVGNFLPGVNIVLLAVYVLAVLLVTGSRLRRHMRQRYKIPSTCARLCQKHRNNNNNHRRTNHQKAKSRRRRQMAAAAVEENSRLATLEDGCCMLACGCCALIQMARHTHNDREYPGYACTVTGLEVGAPRLV